MNSKQIREQRILEIMLTVVCVGLTCMLYLMHGHKMVILNLFFLPVVLSGFFLGRYRAGVLALFCVVSASVVTAFRLTDLATATSPLVITLAIAVWGAVLGLTALLVGTLSDERTGKIKELHEAYVGVVEVLSQYLQSAHPRLKARSIQVAELSQEVAATMNFSPRQVDDVRVAALLYDVGNIEVTTKVIRRAVDSFEDEPSRGVQHTFQGMDLMLSLGSVLSGAIPLLLNQDDTTPESIAGDRPATPGDVPIGARIIRAVRAYGKLIARGLEGEKLSPAEAVKRLQSDPAAEYGADVLDALQQIVSRTDQTPTAEAESISSDQPEVPAEV